MLLNNVADKLVFKFLSKINYGYLELTTFDGNVLKFGNPNDKLQANILIKKQNFNYNLIRGGSIGFAESYMRGEFETDNLSNLIELTARNIEIIHKFSGILDFPIINFVKNKIIKNTKSRSKQNIAKHYDLGNDFFSLWLDETLTYSSAIFNDNSKNLIDNSGDFTDNAKLSSDTNLGNYFIPSKSTHLNEENQEAFDLQTYKKFLSFLKFQEMMDKYNT